MTRYRGPLLAAAVVVGAMLLLACGGAPAPARPSPPDDTSPANSCGLTLRPSTQPRAVELGVGFEDTCARMSDGTVQCWGRSYPDGRGQPRAIANIRQAVSLFMGGDLVCVGDGSAKHRCWGRSVALDVDQEAPAPVAALDGASDMSVAGDEVCAQWADGTTRCGGPWLGHMQGQKQLALAKGLSHAATVRMSNTVGCALERGGTVACWGLNELGQLGDGSTSRRPQLGRVVGLTGVSRLFVGNNFPCALHTDGGVSCWGALDDSPAALGPEAPRSLTAQRLTIDDVCEVAAGRGFACVRHGAGGVSCWGQNYWGQLGRGKRANDFEIDQTPARVMGIKDAVQVVAGTDHACALSIDGQVQCWGAGEHGQLGDGLRSARAEPHFVRWGSAAPTRRPLPRELTIAQIAVSSSHSCALLSDGDLRCWGFNREHQAAPASSEDIVPVARSLERAAVVMALGSDFTLVGGEQATWRLYGLGATSPRVIPMASARPDDEVVGERGRLCHRHDGVVDCFGVDTPLGDGVRRRARAGEAVRVKLPPATALAGNHFASCAIDDAGRVWCWGDNARGVLGNGSELPESLPQPVTGIAGAKAVGMSDRHTCVLSRDGAVHCWGDGVLTGDGDPKAGCTTCTSGTVPRAPWHGPAPAPMYPRLTPVRIAGIDDAVALAVGSYASCVVRAGGPVACWGGPFGYTPINVPWLHGARAITLGSSHGCAILNSGVRCFGDDSWGQLGDPWRDVEEPYADVRW